jgi:hypothetical protein
VLRRDVIVVESHVTHGPTNNRLLPVEWYLADDASLPVEERETRNWSRNVERRVRRLKPAECTDRTAGFDYLPTV